MDSAEVCTLLNSTSLVGCFEPSYIFLAQLPCEVCHKNDRGEEMLLCDNCDCGTLPVMFQSFQLIYFTSPQDFTCSAWTLSLPRCLAGSGFAQLAYSAPGATLDSTREKSIPCLVSRHATANSAGGGSKHTPLSKRVKMMMMQQPTRLATCA
jgi:hypothetical protein